MPCALCTRYRTNGTSRCPGCSHDGYYTDMCKVHRCCREKNLMHCGICKDFPCARLGKMSDFRDLDTDNVKIRSCTSIAASGFAQWYAEYSERAELLTAALERYNDGRMKRFLCELFIKSDISLLRNIMHRGEDLNGTPKENGKKFKELVASLQDNTP